MRKYVLFALIVLFVLSLTGCGTEDKGTGKDGKSVKNTETNETEEAGTVITPHGGALASARPAK